MELARTVWHCWIFPQKSSLPLLPSPRIQSVFKSFCSTSQCLSTPLSLLLFFLPSFFLSSSSSFSFLLLSVCVSPSTPPSPIVSHRNLLNCLLAVLSASSHLADPERSFQTLSWSSETPSRSARRPWEQRSSCPCSLCHRPQHAPDLLQLLCSALQTLALACLQPI